jgi:hypothetical protein
MTIQEMGALGEMIGGIAVVISLIYVGLQVRQNSNSVRAASQIALRQLGTEITSQLAAPDMARIYIQGLKDLSPLPAEDRVRFHSLMLSLFGVYEAYYFQVYFGIIPQELQPTRNHAMALFHLQKPGVRQWWDGGGRDQFSDKFVEKLEQAQGKPAA